MTPTQIRVVQGNEKDSAALDIKWDDGHDGRISLKSLRDNCPCAGCRGETVLLKSYRPPPRLELPGMYTLKNAQQVGSYAIGVAWGDGHSTGIYTFQTLRDLCECNECLAQRPTTQAQK